MFLVEWYMILPKKKIQTIPASSGRSFNEDIPVYYISYQLLNVVVIGVARLFRKLHPCWQLMKDMSAIVAPPEN